MSRRTLRRRMVRAGLLGAVLVCAAPVVAILLVEHAGRLAQSAHAATFGDDDEDDTVWWLSLNTGTGGR